MEHVKMRYSSAMVEMALEERDEEIQRLQEICDGYEATITKLKVDIANLNNEINGHVITPYQSKLREKCFIYDCDYDRMINDTVCFYHSNDMFQFWLY